MHDSASTTVASATAKVAPAVGAAAWAHWGLTLQDVASIFAITYSSLMITFLLLDRVNKYRRKHASYHA